MRDWFSLKGRVALVTGASRGIGQAIAQAFGAAGADVACCARSQAQIDGTAKEIRERGGRAAAITLDVTSAPDIERAVREVEAALGPVDVLVNNAGIILEKKTIDLTDDEWDS